MSVASKALGIPELLEKILFELAPLAIIRCERVSRTWKALIIDSHLLQYKTWRRNDVVANAEYVSPPLRQCEKYFASDAEQDANTQARYKHDMSTFLNPIIVSRILKSGPEDPDWYHAFARFIEVGEYETFHFKPVLLRDLVQWCEGSKATEDMWGSMSLYRPGIHRINWHVPCSDESATTFDLEAMRADDPEADQGNMFYTKHVAKKGPEELLVLTLSDLFRELDAVWLRYVDSERTAHYVSHGRGECDYGRGFPERCLEPRPGDDENVGKYGTKVKRGEEYLNACVLRASIKMRDSAHWR